MEFVSSKKTYFILGAILLVAVALPASVYLFQSGYFDTRNRAAVDESEDDNNETVDISGNIVAQWNFNEESGDSAMNNAGDSSCRDNPAGCDGILVNMDDTSGRDVSTTSGWTSVNKRNGDGALMFDGENDRVKLTKPSVFKEQIFSIGAWINISEIGSKGGIFGFNNSNGYKGWVLRVQDDGTLRFVTMNAGGGAIDAVNSASPLEIDTWYYVVVTLDESSVKLYLDAVQIDEDEDKQEVIYGATHYPQIGRQSGHTANRFTGVMDTMRFWDIALSSDQIAQLYAYTDFENMEDDEDPTPDDPTPDPDDCANMDVNEDGEITLSDYSLFVEDYVDNRHNNQYQGRSDFNEDEDLTLSDYALFVACYVASRQ